MEGSYIIMESWMSGLNRFPAKKVLAHRRAVGSNPTLSTKSDVNISGRPYGKNRC